LMNKKIAISTSFLLLFTVTGTLRAQYATSWWGLRAGADLANESLTPPDNASVGMRAGALGGLVFEHWFNDTWGLGAGLLYDQKGASETYASSAYNREITVGSVTTLYSGTDNFTLSYLEVPVLLKFSFGEGDIRPYIAAGPSFGFLLSASENTTSVAPNEGTIAPIDNLKSYMQSLDVSIYGGLGLADEIYHGPMLTFDAGYAAGMTKIFKSNPTRVATNGQSFPAPIDLSTAKSADIVIAIGILWRM
ncbi:MAG: porin family protein, partial [Candidatus Kapaibacterium sp.]